MSQSIITNFKAAVHKIYSLYQTIYFSMIPHAFVFVLTFSPTMFVNVLFSYTQSVMSIIFSHFLFQWQFLYWTRSLNCKLLKLILPFQLLLDRKSNIWFMLFPLVICTFNRDKRGKLKFHEWPGPNPIKLTKYFLYYAMKS